MKQYIFLFLTLFIVIHSTAQDMSIEFSIEWKDKLDFHFNEFKDENIRPAYLNITYRNVSNRPLYCLKIADGKAGLPEIILFFDSMPNMIEKSWLRVNDDYFKRRYFIGFKSNPSNWKGASWNVRNDTTDIEYQIIKKTWKRPVYDIGFIDQKTGKLVVPSGYIGDDTVPDYDWLFNTLNNIYNVIYHRYYMGIQKKMRKNSSMQIRHYSSNITQDTIISKFIDKFVFLKPGETYVDKYNLIGFQITGGTFTFQLDDTKSLDYVETEPIDKEKLQIDGSNNYLRKQLPLKVGEYELFTGNFLTNKVIVYFPGIRLKE